MLLRIDAAAALAGGRAHGLIHPASGCPTYRDGLARALFMTDTRVETGDSSAKCASGTGL